MSKINLMKTILGFSAGIILITFFLSCRQSPTNQTLSHSKAQLEVIYFHTSERCPACIAIENNTKKVLDDLYKAQIDRGIIKFTSCNIDDRTNKALVEKYQVSYLTLLIIKPDGTKRDFTDNAFKYADTNPEKFMDLLKAEIDKSLR
jgi:hypothetical protein